MRKLAPKGFDVSFLTCSSSRVTFSGESPPTETIPNAPALETAAASSGFASAAIPACCIGTLQPISLVNFVSNMRTNSEEFACLRIQRTPSISENDAAGLLGPIGIGMRIIEDAKIVKEG